MDRTVRLLATEENTRESFYSWVRSSLAMLGVCLDRFGHLKNGCDRRHRIQLDSFERSNSSIFPMISFIP
jgi:hypothetical protein